MLSKIMKANFKIFNNKNKVNPNLLISFKNFYNISSSKMTSVNKLKDEQNINDMHKYINSFTGKKFERVEDSLIVDIKLLGKPFIKNQKYPVFKSNIGKKIIKVFLLQLIMVIPVAVLLYYSWKWLKEEWILYRMNRSSKFYVAMYSSLAITSLVILNLLRKNNLYKIWTYVQKIDLSKDLKNLQITTFTNSVINPELKDVFLFYNFSSPYISHKSMSKVEDTLVIGVKDRMYVIPLDNATIQSKDLLSLCVRGYKMKFKEN